MPAEVLALTCLILHKTPGEIMRLPKGERAFVFAAVKKSPELLGMVPRRRSRKTKPAPG